MFTHALVVDDHADALHWLEASLRRAFPGIAVSTAATFADGAEQLERQPQLALIDLDLPDGFGIDLVLRAGRMSPPVRSVITTVYDDDAHIFPALRAGACGYLLKDEPQDELVRQLLQLARNEPPISSAVMRSVLRHFAEQGVVRDGAAEPLTAREREVLTMIANGYTLDEIARSQAVTRNTVATHVKRIYSKLKIGNRAEAVQAAQRLGLLARS